MEGIRLPLRGENKVQMGELAHNLQHFEGGCPPIPLADNPVLQIYDCNQICALLFMKILKFWLLTAQNKGTNVVKVTVLIGPNDKGHEFGNLPQKKT